MSKKRFSEGLDDLFNDNDHLVQAVETPLLATTPAVKLERKAHGKNFVSDLDALLQEAMEESFERYESRQQPSAAPGKSKSVTATQKSSNYRAPLSGLDALIRQTIDVREMTDEDFAKKRLTVAVDKMKLDKLKVIARLENSFLKDILVSLIDEYIVEYSHKKGIDL